MLRNQQLLTVVANAPGDIPCAVEINGAAYPLGAAEVRGGTLVLIGHDSAATKPARAGKTNPVPPKTTAAPEAAAGEGMELK